MHVQLSPSAKSGGEHGDDLAWAFEGGGDNGRLEVRCDFDGFAASENPLAVDNVAHTDVEAVGTEVGEHLGAQGDAAAATAAELCVGHDPHEPPFCPQIRR